MPSSIQSIPSIVDRASTLRHADDEEKTVASLSETTHVDGERMKEDIGLDNVAFARVDHPWRIKGFALFLVVLLNSTPRLTLSRFLPPCLIDLFTDSVFLAPFKVGPNWTTASIPSLKSTFVAELNINNAQYSDVSSYFSL